MLFGAKPGRAQNATATPGFGPRRRDDPQAALPASPDGLLHPFSAQAAARTGDGLIRSRTKPLKRRSGGGTQRKQRAVRRLAQWLLVAFALSWVPSGHAAAQADAATSPGALERVQAVWAAVDWRGPWEKHGTTPQEALEVVGALGGQLSGLILFGPDLRGAAILAGWLAADGGRVARAVAATGEAVLIVVLATGETVAIVVEAAGAALAVAAEAAGGTVEGAARWARDLDLPRSFGRMLTAPDWARRLWIE